VLNRHGNGRPAEVVIHPRYEKWAAAYPELAALRVKCPMLGQLMVHVRQARALSVREEKVLLGTLSHLPRGREYLHHLFSELPEYNRPLLDYRISRVRGTPLGCKRIHSLLDEGGASLPCRFDTAASYPHPLLHLDGYQDGDAPKCEKVENLKDAVAGLKAALVQLERFLD